MTVQEANDNDNNTERTQPVEIPLQEKPNDEYDCIAGDTKM